MKFRRRRLALALAACAAAAAATVAAWWLSAGVDLEPWRSGRPPVAWSALSRQEEKWRSEGSRRRVEFEYRPLAAISPELQLAVLVSEDISFFGHGAFDPRAVWEALGEWWQGGRLRGASTIAQQLARVLFLSRERTLWRKAEEVRLAWWMERRLGKRRVLELYLNAVEFGPGVFGAEAAAQRYFGRPAGALAAAEAAALAAAIPSPGRDNPQTATPRWSFRRDLILRRMARATWLRRQLGAT
jgi:monofunctional biosynthetic peptidoglycan transglycosylase